MTENQFGCLTAAFIASLGIAAIIAMDACSARTAEIELTCIKQGGFMKKDIGGHVRCTK